MKTNLFSETAGGLARVSRSLRTAMVATLAVALCLLPRAGLAIQGFTYSDINPDKTDIGPAGGSGGRVNGLGSLGDNQIFYAASEWGGLYMTTNGGREWQHLDGHLPTATWDVEVVPGTTNVASATVYATSFYDGRVSSVSGIQVSYSGGATWTHPASATPPATFSCNPAVGGRDEPAAFGIGIRRIQVQPDTTLVAIGTNCGLAFSVDSGMNWQFITPITPAKRVWDVVVQAGGTIVQGIDQGIIDICGDDGHWRTTNRGMTWTTRTGGNVLLPPGPCSIAVSPDEPNVLFVAATDNKIYESDNGGSTWNPRGTPEPVPQGRFPFVETNKRSGTRKFDLWFGDIVLFRGDCTSRDPADTGPQVPRCPVGFLITPVSCMPSCPQTPNNWFAVNLAHGDMGDIVFDGQVAIDTCPQIYSSDGGIYRNTQTQNPACHDSPSWTQPDKSPHALWLFGMHGADQTGKETEDLYFATQDNGFWITRNAGAGRDVRLWTNRFGDDAFDAVADSNRVLFSGVGATYFTLFVVDRGVPFGTFASVTRPPGTANTSPPVGPFFQFPDFLDRIADQQYVAATNAGVFTTNGITATRDYTNNPATWTPLGTNNNPTGIGFCGVRAAVTATTTTFYAHTNGVSGLFSTPNNCFAGEGQTPAQLWRYNGTATTGTWQQVFGPGGQNFPNWMGIVAVDPNNPNRLYASDTSPSTGVPQMVCSADGGNTWRVDAQLDARMTGSGQFKYATRTGPTSFTTFSGYSQPSLLAFDPENPNIIVAGGRDSGVFLTQDSGANWTLITDPFFPDLTGTPHLPRPYFAYFDHEFGADVQNPNMNLHIYIGTQGRGAWRISTTNVAPTVRLPLPCDLPPATVETKTGGSSSSLTVKTSSDLTAVSGHLYLAAISTKPDVAVDSVEGLGLNWTLVHAQCSDRAQTRVEVWAGSGTPAGSGRVTAKLVSKPLNAVIAVSRYARALGIGNPVSANRMGPDGACMKSSDRSVDTGVYSVDLPVRGVSSVAYGAAAIRLRSHTPGPGFTEQAMVRQGSEGDVAGLAIEDQAIAAPSMVTVTGTLNRPTDWAVIAVEIQAMAGP